MRQLPINTFDPEVYGCSYVAYCPCSVTDLGLETTMSKVVISILTSSGIKIVRKFEEEGHISAALFKALCAKFFTSASNYDSIKDTVESFVMSCNDINLPEEFTDLRRTTLMYFGDYCYHKLHHNVSKSRYEYVEKDFTM